MLPAPARLRSSADFRATVRKGVTAGRDTLVVHMRCAEPTTTPPGDAQVGFVVSKSVGNAVTRNRVKRKLRHQSAELLPATPAGVLVVVRALPAAAQPEAQLTADLRGAWQKALTRLMQRNETLANAKHDLDEASCGAACGN